ncbi:MAG: rod shape-determining protein RodA [Deltaproteobacteria bacterium]|nr:rod shape-determining protein RodA [Deltaproteobacteria bacterium]
MKNSEGSGTPRFWSNFDWGLFGTIGLICFVGLATLYSSTYLNQRDIFIKQIIFISVGFGIALIGTIIDYRIFERLAYPFYILVVALLILVTLAGKSVYGSQRWLPLGPIHLQPSELAKLAIVLVLARFYSREKVGLMHGYGFKELLPVFGLVGLPMILVFKQPDLGTALMIGFVAFTVVLFCNLRMQTLIIFSVSVLVIAPIAYKFVLKEYQRDRVRTFLDPGRDPLGDGYHSIQSMITVGSGQLMGKGYLKGTQSKLEFLPKHHTDFIFSAYAEEWGFMGSIFLISLFMILVFLGIDICRKSKDKFGAVLAMGALAIIIWHVIVNMGMEIGVLPVVGVTLPFFSYGGSSLITNMLAVGILSSVSIRRHIF